MDKEKDIKKKYKEFKLRNEALKAETYAQYFKQTPTNQNRLMSAFYIKTGKMKMKFMQPIVQQPRSSVDYRKTNFEVLAKDVHPIDKLEFHKQASEMIYSIMTNKAMTMHKLKSSLDNITTKLERASSQAKDNRIKSLEDLVMEMGYNPNDVKVAEKL